MNGIFPILATPFDDKGQIDFEDLEREVEWMINVGVNGVGIAVASEIYKLTDPERDEVLSSVVKQVNGRAPVVMNTGAMGTDVTVYYSQRAEELGANALMIRPPSFIAMPAGEVIEFFARVGESVGIPIFQQDQATAQVSPGMALEIARRHENLCYIKVETAPTVPRMAETAALRDAATDAGGDLILVCGNRLRLVGVVLKRQAVHDGLDHDQRRCADRCDLPCNSHDDPEHIFVSSCRHQTRA
jgi:4-hydroxy-tetrahydrodipicolinate synthase